MKSILLSVRPEWLAKILNGEKTIEIRKKFPKDYVGWVYLYCSKGNKKNWHLIEVVDNAYSKTEYEYDYYIGSEGYLDWCLDGKVVARFWCDNVEEIELWYSPARADNCVDYDEWYYETETLDEDDLLYGSCLSQENLTNYLCRKDNSKGFAIHISKLEIFDKPRELSELSGVRPNGLTYMLEKAPQSFIYIEGE